MLTLVVPGIWLGGFLIKEENGHNANRLAFIWLESLLVICILFTSIVFIGTIDPLFKAIFLLASFIILQAVILLMSFAHQIDQDRNNISKDLVALTDRLVCIMKNVQDGIIVTDSQGKIWQTNTRIKKLTGYNQNEMTHHHIDEFIRNGGYKHEDSSSEYHAQLYLESKKEMKIPIRLKRAQVEARGGTFYLYLIHDLTTILREKQQREKLQKQIERMQKMEMLSSIANRVAHDVNNFLGSILGYLRSALNDLTPEKPVYEKLLQIRRITERMSELMKKLRASSTIEKRQVRPYSPNEGIREVISLLQGTHEDAIKFDLYLDPEIPFIMIDPLEYIRVIMNISTNAIRAMNGKGRIIYETSERTLNEKILPDSLKKKQDDKSIIEIKITDNGPGISPEMQDKIFDPFFTTKEKEGGTGLGLNIVMNIVETFRGAIDFSSEQNVGTTFYLYFPALNEIGNSSKPRLNFPKLDDQFILIALDDEVVNNSILRCLHSMNCDKIEVCGDDPLSKIDDKNTNILLIIDEKNLLQIGFSLEILKKLYPNLKLICLCEDTKESRKKLEFAVWLVQPFSVERFLIVLEQLISD